MSTGRCVQSQLHGLSGQDQCSANSLLQGNTADHSEGEGLQTTARGRGFSEWKWEGLQTTVRGRGFLLQTARSGRGCLLQTAVHAEVGGAACCRLQCMLGWEGLLAADCSKALSSPPRSLRGGDELPGQGSELEVGEEEEEEDEDELWSLDREQVCLKLFKEYCMIKILI